MNEYDIEEIEAGNALDLWQSIPDTITCNLSHADNVAHDSYGNVLGTFDVVRERKRWHASLYGEHGCTYTAWLVDCWQGSATFTLHPSSYILRDKVRRERMGKESRKKIAPPLARPQDFIHNAFTGSDSSQNNQTKGIADMKTSNIIKNIARTIIDATQFDGIHEVAELLEDIKDNIGNDFNVTYGGFDWRIIENEDIDQILEDEMSDDEYRLGCFTNWALADVLPMDADKIEQLQENEAFDALGAMVVSLGKVGELAQILVSHDGYGHHFSSYDGETLEAGEYYVFNQG